MPWLVCLTANLLVSVLILSTPALAITEKIEQLQNAAAALSNCTSSPKVNCAESSNQGYTTGVIQVSGTFVATVAFQASVDGTNFTPLECFSIADRSSPSINVTVTGAWRCNLIGIAKVRTPISAYTSGSITVWMKSVSAGVF